MALYFKMYRERVHLKLDEQASYFNTSQFVFQLAVKPLGSCSEAGSERGLW